MSQMTFDFGEMVQFQRALNKVGQLPQKAVTRAAGKGRTVVRKAIRGVVPVGKTGNLKRSIVSRGERSKVKGKKVYDLMFDPGMNDVLQRPIQNPGAAGGKNKKAYYPASMEYGFLTRANEGTLKFVQRKTGLGLSRVEGRHFMRDAAESSAPAAKTAIIQTLTAELDKEWQK